MEQSVLTFMAAGSLHPWLATRLVDWHSTWPPIELAGIGSVIRDLRPTDLNLKYHYNDLTNQIS